MDSRRWGRVAEVFDEVLLVSPERREDWLRSHCGPDGELFDEVRRLVAAHERAERDGFLSLADRDDPAAGSSLTVAWDQRKSPAAEAGGPGFSPFDAIQSASDSRPSPGSQDMARRRLSGLATTCLVITVLFLFWKYAVAHDPDATQAVPYVLLIAALGVLDFALYGPRRFSPGAMEAMEAGMILTVAAVYAFGQYQTMLDFSVRGDPERAEEVFNHRVMISTVLILSYGVYAPSSWARAALVLGSLALIPFVTLAALQAFHPGTMSWMSEPGPGGTNAHVARFAFNAMLLLILAAWAGHGAYTIDRLRRQAREARRLGQYRLIRRLGEGGMGEVHLAEHQFLKRPCALKLIRPGVAMGAKALERFEREVRITAELSHPNTVEVYDYGRTEDGEYYYVMEYLPGLSLEDLVRRHGPQPPARAIYFLRQVCLALEEAHAAGLVHRDIKPSNIFASRRGGVDDVAKLLDFGLVRPVAPGRAPGLSAEGQILGTPTYMSPEQATGGEVDGRSDVYSLGAVAFFLLTGRPPFADGGSIEILIAVARDPAPAPSQVRPGLPEDLDRIVLRCLAKSPGERFPDVRSLELALADCSDAGGWDKDEAARWWREHEPLETGHDHVRKTAARSTSKAAIGSQP